MESRKERLKKTLGISEYPWSSDDDDNETTPTNPLNLVRKQASDAPRPSVGEIPGTSGEPPLASSPSNSPALKAQAKFDRDLFWSLINNPAPTRSRAYEPGMPSTSHSSRLSETAPSSAERREPGPERSASVDVQRVLTRWKSRDEFMRFTKSLNAMRNSRHNNNVYPVYSRNTSGPSRNPLFNQSQSTNLEVIKPIFKNHIPKRIYFDRPGSSRSSRFTVSSTGATCGSETFDAGRLHSGPEELHPDTFNVDLSDDDLDIPSASRLQSMQRDDQPADSSIDTIAAMEDVPHDTSGGTSDEPAVPAESAARVSDCVDGGDRHAREEGAEAAGAVPSTSQHNREKKKRDKSEESSEPLTVKEFNQSLLRLLECPVCMEWMEPPIAQCRRGHLVCTLCRARLAACPVCRTTFSSVRNRAMEGVSELLRYPCRHQCGREVRLRRRGAHEASCSARRYPCPVAGCALRPPLPHHDLAHHLQSNHLDMLKIGPKHKFTMKVNSEHHHDWIITMNALEFFHLRVDVDMRNWGIVFYVAYIGPKSNAKNFTYNITINGQHNSRKLSYSRVTHSDLERPSLGGSRQDCFHLTLDQAINFLRMRNRHCDPDKYLDFNVEIAKTEDDEENNETLET